MTRFLLVRACAVTTMGIACAALGCDEGSPADPAYVPATPIPAAEADAGAEGDGAVADGDGGYAVCPDGLDASFGSLLTQMFSTASCGTARPNNCHSASGASPRGTGNLLDFTKDVGGVYAELLADGGGQLAANIAGSAKLSRVVPLDADASLLYIKLTLKSHADLQYGAGMPETAPGSVCPAALEAVRDWIDRGAAAN